MSEPTEPPLPPTVKALGVVSLCTDLSSEMVYPVNPLLLRALGAPPEAIGLIEGLAESTASLLKLYSGSLSDRLGQRKPLTLIGYGLAALSKPLIGVAASWPGVLTARVLDRTGKGLRSAPRDALITETIAPDQRGRAFGFHRSMDTTGAVFGPLVGFFFLQAYPSALRSLYWIAFVPALAGVLVLAFAVREKRKDAPAAETTSPAVTPPRVPLSPALRGYLICLGLFALGNSSDAFLLLRAHEGALIEEKYLLLLYALFNLVEAGLGYAVGTLSDKIGRRPLIQLGWVVFALVYLGFALLTPAWGPVGVGALLFGYGVYYTCTQGTAKALAADLAHPEHRGRELGLFHFLSGFAALPASLLAGWLYHQVGPAVPFFVGAAMALLAAATLTYYSKLLR